PMLGVSDTGRHCQRHLFAVTADASGMRNMKGAFLIPYITMLIFGGLPLFYMELALGQYQRCGCFTVWTRICPMFKGIGLAICVMTTFVAWYYNTIIAWAVYFFFSSFRNEPPWMSCNNTWNTENCTTFDQRVVPKIQDCEDLEPILAYNETYPYNLTATPFIIEENGYTINMTTNVTHIFRSKCHFKTQEVDESQSFYFSAASTEFFEREVLQIQYADGIARIGGVKWTIAMALFGVFILVYFALWKGIKSSGKAVWITATLPYALLFILLIRGHSGINCMSWRDALLTSAVNCLTSFLAGFVVFSVLGYMAFSQRRHIQDVARQDVGLIFVVYPEAVATIGGASFWAVIFFFMVITLGLDTTFGALEAVITGVLDEFPMLRKKREIFVAGLMLYCFLGSLITTTYGGIYVVQLFDTYAAPISILLVVFLEAVAVNWIYGVDRFSGDIESMLGKPPGAFWRVTWTYISPVFLLALFVLSVSNSPPPSYGNYVYPYWSLTVGWLIVCSSLVCIPLYIIVCFFKTSGSFTDRLRQMITPAEVPSHLPEKRGGPVFL
ncbi:hypothetical protein BaRGS_00002862, partial [Batillaria attramentaria]